MPAEKNTGPVAGLQEGLLDFGGQIPVFGLVDGHAHHGGQISQQRNIAGVTAKFQGIQVGLVGGQHIDVAGSQGRSDLRPGNRHRPGTQRLPESMHQWVFDHPDFETAQVLGGDHRPIGSQHPLQPPQPVPLPIDQADPRSTHRFEQLLLKKPAAEKGLTVRFGIEGIRQRKNLETIDELAIIEKLFYEQIDEAVFELIDLVDGGADLGRAQRNQLQVPSGQFANLLGKPVNAFVFRASDCCQRSQHPGHFMQALKEVADRTVKNPTQARQGLYRQRGLAIFNLGKLPLGEAGLTGQDNGRNSGRLPQFPDPGADPTLDAFFQFVCMFGFPFHPLKGSRLFQSGARPASRGL